MLKTLFKDLLYGDFDFRNLVTKAPMGIMILYEESFIIKFANKSLLNMLSISWEDIKNKPLKELIPDIKEQGISDILTHVFQAGEPYSGVEIPIKISGNISSDEVKMHKDNGQSKNTYYINAWINPFSDSSGQTKGIIMVGTDVTELVKSRNASRENEAKYKGLVYSMNQGFAIIELIYNDENQPVDYRFIEINPMFKEITGFYDVEGRTAREMVPDLENNWIIVYDEVARTGDNISFTQHSDALQQTYEVQAFKIGNTNSRKVALLFTDVTLRQQNETNQKKFAKQLQIQVEKRTLELEKANSDLIHFMHVSSHDLKEPVRKIKTFATFLKNEYEKDLSLHAVGLISKILSASDRLNTMIEGVLNYSLSDTSRQDISEIDLGEVIKHIVNDLEVLIHYKKVTFNIGNMLHLEGAKVLIYQVLYNIIFNSIKFSHNEVPLVINIDSVSERHEGRDYVKVSIADNGIGFEDKYAERIFEPFFRLHSKDHYEGAGLGLALCKRIVERHSGKIYASGKLNEGATFTILLPVMQSRNYL